VAKAYAKGARLWAVIKRTRTAMAWSVPRGRSTRRMASRLDFQEARGLRVRPDQADPHLEVFQADRPAAVLKYNLTPVIHTPSSPNMLRLRRRRRDRGLSSR